MELVPAIPLVHTVLLVLALLVADVSAAEHAPVASDLHVNTCPPPYLAVLYPEPNFKGEPFGITELDRAFTRTFASFRVARGFRLYLDPRSEKDQQRLQQLRVMAEDSPVWPKPGGASPVERCTVKVIRSVPSPRPRIFMAIHGAGDLSDDKFDSQWTYVRRNLDGLWFNPAGVPPGQWIGILKKVRTRTVIPECPGEPPDPKNPPTEMTNPVTNGFGLNQGEFRMGLDREGAARWNGKEGMEWIGDHVKIMRNQFAPAGLQENEKWKIHRNIYIGFLGGVSLRDGEPTPPPLKAAIAEADGLWTEAQLYPLWPFFRLVREAHAKPRGIWIWFCSNPSISNEEEFTNFKSAYYKLETEGLIKPTDVIMLINYQSAVDRCPEIDPATDLPPHTLTGNLNWLLHQGQLNRTEAVRFAKEYLKKGDEWSAWVVLERMVRYTIQGDLPNDDIEPSRLAQAMAMLQATGGKVRAKDWLAAEKEIETVIAHLEKAQQPSQQAGRETPSNEPTKAVVRATPTFNKSALPQWTERLRAYIKETVAAGTRPQCRLNLMGDAPSTVKLLAADDQGLTVELSGGKLPVQWSQLKTPDYVALAQGCTSEQDARSQVLVGVFLCATGRIEDGNTWLAKAMLVDPSSEAWVKEAREALKAAQQ